MVSKFEKFDVLSLSFEEVQVSLRDSVLLPRVGSGECPLFQLPYLVTLGVPKQGKFFPTEKDRLFVQLVLEGEVLGNSKALDEFLGSEAFKLKLFGAQGASYEYSPIVKQGPKGEHMKIKLQTNHETGSITTTERSNYLLFFYYQFLVQNKKRLKMVSSRLIKMVFR